MLIVLQNIGSVAMAHTIQTFEYTPDSDCAMEWESWLHSFEIFRDASMAVHGEEQNWSALLLLHAGPKVQQVHNMLVAQEPNEAAPNGPLVGGYIQRDPYHQMINRLSTFFAPKRHPTYERHVLRKMKQKDDERIDMFVMRLRQQADRCEYGERVDEFLKVKLCQIQMI